MSAVILPLAKAAVFGVVLGVGARSMVSEEERPEWLKNSVFGIAVVASVALRAIAWYFGVTAAVGAVAGMSLKVYQNWYKMQKPETLYQTLVEGALFGGAIGYLLEQGALGLAR